MEQPPKQPTHVTLPATVVNATLEYLLGADGRRYLTASPMSLPVTIVNAALDYMATKPFREVFELIGALKTAADASFKEQQGQEREE